MCWGGTSAQIYFNTQLALPAGGGVLSLPVYPRTTVTLWTRQDILVGKPTTGNKNTVKRGKFEAEFDLLICMIRLDCFYHAECSLHLFFSCCLRTARIAPVSDVIVFTALQEGLDLVLMSLLIMRIVQIAYHFPLSIFLIIFCMKKSM